MVEYTLEKFSKSGYHETGERRHAKLHNTKLMGQKGRRQVAELAGFFHGIKYHGVVGV